MSNNINVPDHIIEESIVADALKHASDRQLVEELFSRGYDETGVKSALYTIGEIKAHNTERQMNGAIF